MTTDELIAQTVKILKNDNLFYLVKAHPHAHDNYFYKTQGAQVYDVAYYSPVKVTPNKNHHHHSLAILRKDNEQFKKIKTALEKVDWAIPDDAQHQVKKLIEHAELNCMNDVDLFDLKKSLFYFRCEDWEDQLLIGNTQIECQKKENWPKPHGDIILNKNNLKKTMVQAAIAHALQTGKERILFHAGSAMEISQWFSPRNSMHSRILINKRNYNKYFKLHQQALKKFDNYKAGDIMDDNGYKVIIYKKTDKQIYKHSLGAAHLIPLVYILANKYSYQKIARKEILRDKIIPKKIKSEGYITDLNHEILYTLYDIDEKRENNDSKTLAHIALYKKLKYYFKKQDAENTLLHINKLFNYLVDIDFNSKTAEKTKYLTQLVKDKKITENKKIQG